MNTQNDGLKSYILCFMHCTMWLADRWFQYCLSPLIIDIVHVRRHVLCDISIRALELTTYTANDHFNRFNYSFIHSLVRSFQASFFAIVMIIVYFSIYSYIFFSLFFPFFCCGSYRYIVYVSLYLSVCRTAWILNIHSSQSNNFGYVYWVAIIPLIIIIVMNFLCYFAKHCLWLLFSL